MSTRTRLIVSIVSIALSIYIVIATDTRYGLDLKGGSQIVLDLKARAGEDVNKDLAQRTLEVMNKRVNGLGVSEAKLAISGNNRLIVDLPGVNDTERAKQVIGSTAQLTIHPVVGMGDPTQTTAPAPAASASTPSSTSASTSAPTTAAPPSTSAGALGTPSNSASQKSGQILGDTVPPSPATTPPPATSTTAATPGTATTATTATTAAAPNAQPASGQQGGSQTGAMTATDDSGRTYQLGPAVVTGEGIKTAEAMISGQGGSQWAVSVTFKGDAQKAWTKLTAEEACKPQEDPTRQSAFVLDGRIIEVSGPRVGDVVCGQGIVGDTTEISGGFNQESAKTLALLIRGGALPVDVQIASSRYVGPELGKAAIHASVLAIIIGGILTVVFLFGYYRLLGLVAGLALGIYALISFATLLQIGVTLTLPGIAGFVLAVAMAMDSNILVYERVKEEFANGRSLRQAAQLGFKNALSAIIDSNATTFLAAGVLFLVATGEVKGFGITLLLGTAVSIFVTLVVLRTLVTSLLSMDWAHNRPKLLGMYVGSKFRTRMSENPPNLMGMWKWFLATAILVTVLALAGIGVRGINYGIEFTGGRVIEYQTERPIKLETARERISGLGIGHATLQNTGTSQASAEQNTTVRSKTLSDEQVKKLDALMKELGGDGTKQVQNTNVGPSFGAELKRKALLGLAAGLCVQLLWVAWRFRWTFGIGAVVAMAHDALLILGIFAWFGKEFNAVFLAALLTVIAYSVNDTVVVFDRIREQRRRRAGENFAHVVSDACAQTFPRTVNLSLSALFILGALFVLGGETLSDFSLALVIGVVTGVTSSIAIASPIAVLLERWKPAISARQSSSPKRSNAKAGARHQSPAVSSSESPHSSSEDSENSDESVVTKPATTGAKRPNPRPRKRSKKRR